MKSIEQITSSFLPAMQKTYLPMVRLPSRPLPLEIDDIEKMDVAIGRHFTIVQNPQYGYIPVKDDSGEVIRQEFDVVGRDEIYTPLGETPQALRDALLRPAERRHIIFHLTRLAAHRRDTRGKEALTAVLEDIAYDLRNVSEWAVVMACREFRQKPNIWYPTTGEIIGAIESNQSKLESIPLAPADPKMMAQQERKLIAEKKEIRWQDLPQAEWLPQHFDHAIGECEDLLMAAKGSPMGLSPEYWESKIAKMRKDKIKREQEIAGA